MSYIDMNSTGSDGIKEDVNRYERSKRERKCVDYNDSSPTTVAVESKRVKMNTSNIQRIKKELVMLLKTNMRNVQIAPNTDDITSWIATLNGTPGTPYEGGQFYLEINFPIDYPFKPPKIKFQTKIYHCNISYKGDICLDILKKNWSPALTMEQVFLSLSLLLSEPNPGNFIVNIPEDPLDSEIAKHFITDRRGHDKVAREWTSKYSSKI